MCVCETCATPLIYCLTLWYGTVQKVWKDGSLAEKMLCPAECLTVIEQPNQYTPGQWASLCWLGISYGGLLRGEVKPGSTLIVNGGTGGLGSLAVMLALAMGVAKVCHLRTIMMMP